MFLIFKWLSNGALQIFMSLALQIELDGPEFTDYKKIKRAK